MLDLSQSHPDGQSQLFCASQWNRLQRRFRQQRKWHEDIIEEGGRLDKNLKSIEDTAKTNPAAAIRQVKVAAANQDDPDAAFAQLKN